MLPVTPFERALIVTTCPPPIGGRDVHGIYRRLSMFVAAVGGISRHVDILHIVAADHSGIAGDPRFSNAAQSEYWGTNVEVTMAQQEAVQMTLGRYARAAFSLRARPRFSGLATPGPMAAVAACLARGPRFVFVHRLSGMIPFLNLRTALPPLFFDLDDIEHRVKFRSAMTAASPLSRISNLLQVPAMQSAERKAIELSTRTFLCSEEDRSYLASLGMTRGTTTIANALVMPAAVSEPPSTQTVLFLGSYEYGPNAQAADRLIALIWPSVRQRLPSARLIVAGAVPENIAAFHRAAPGVEFTGFVADLGGLYDSIQLICTPIATGGGTRVKLIEAAAWGKPIVSTSVGAEGLCFVGDEEIVIRDSDDAIAAECVRLLQDHQACVRIGAAARRRALAYYDVRAARQAIAASIIEGMMEQ